MAKSTEVISLICINDNCMSPVLCTIPSCFKNSRNGMLAIIQNNLFAKLYFRLLPALLTSNKAGNVFFFYSKSIVNHLKREKLRLGIP